MERVQCQNTIQGMGTITNAGYPARQQAINGWHSATAMVHNLVGRVTLKRRQSARLSFEGSVEGALNRLIEDEEIAGVHVEGERQVEHASQRVSLACEHTRPDVRQNRVFQCH
jgi:hypothetical protein